MKGFNVRFATYLTSWTVGVALILVGVTRLFFIGLSLIILSSFFSHRGWTRFSRIRFRTDPPLVSFSILFLYGVWRLIEGLRSGDVFVREPLGIWWLAALIVVWLWGVGAEYRHWWSERRLAGSA
jgi:hypothetical protein